jgi:hypothetical protein
LTRTSRSPTTTLSSRAAAEASRSTKDIIGTAGTVHVGRWSPSQGARSRSKTSTSPGRGKSPALTAAAAIEEFLQGIHGPAPRPTTPAQGEAEAGAVLRTMRDEERY